MESDEGRELLIETLSLAKMGKISLDDITLVVQKIKLNPFRKFVFEDLHEAITHKPNKFLFSNETDFRIWKGMPEYRCMVADLYLLINCRSEEEALAVRQYIETQELFVDESELGKLLADYKASLRG